MKAIVLYLVLLGLISCSSTLDWRIIGGEEAEEAQFPYQVSIQVLVNGEWKHNCGGSIILDDWILTAAHCVDGYTLDGLSIVTGTNSLSSGGDRYTVSKGMIHSDWNPKLLIADIGLLKTSTKIRFSSTVDKIPLVTTDMPARSRTILSGWGYLKYPELVLPDKLQFISLKSIDIYTCRTLMNEPEHIGPVYESEVCTLSPTGQGACMGDSGGPLVWNGMQVGIVSWGKPCAQGKPDIFTSVRSYLSWIIENTSS